MPTYEYRCPSGHEFEDFVLKISAAKSELPCPTCGAVAARRMSAGSGLLFKGSGFYITDYGKDGKKDQRAAAAKGGDGAASGSKSDAKSGGASSGGEGSATKGDGKSGDSGTAKAAAKPAAPAASGSTGSGTSKAPKSGSSE
ncbi:MAG: zinc ribbon domain-containing protein [Gemmatimonadales bacterium]|nr:zinc ribbon domain-containing protein [Gemmatimonadales bacterium]